MIVVIRERLPALDAALTRFDGWWSGLSQRERLLLSVMAVLLFLAVAVFGVVKPLQAARAQALADIRTYETLNARIRAAGGTLGATAAPQRNGPPLQIVTDSAPSFGLAVTATPTAEGVRAEIADGSYDSILAWTADLAATSPLVLRRASFAPGPASGRVRATLEFGQ
ncbi:type II secretion system protein GspM [Sphingosinithalassobacter sp. CS137]|uniref:type II secretion system protein GspM n=1 Tax=Sphingosinithalassobacter sp. CS137 TaxID=2762748 RepID=UPI00165DE857|nr:type II secretion system protein GspM [Sphingosinithalassobacter sp. CS137]